MQPVDDTSVCCNGPGRMGVPSHEEQRPARGVVVVCRSTSALRHITIAGSTSALRHITIVIVMYRNADIVMYRNAYVLRQEVALETPDFKEELKGAE